MNDDFTELGSSIQETRDMLK